MNKIKFDYEAPAAEAFEVRFEQNIMSDPIKPWEPDDEEIE